MNKVESFSDEEQKRYEKVMEDLSILWWDDKEYHKRNRFKVQGIKSSQISALVAYLVKRGAL